MTGFPPLPDGYSWCRACEQAIRVDIGLGHAPNCPDPEQTVQPRQQAPPARTAPLEPVPDIHHEFVAYGRPVGYKRVGGTFTRTDEHGRTREYRAKDPDVRDHQRAIRDAARNEVPHLAFAGWPVAVEIDCYYQQPKNGRVLPDCTPPYADADNLLKLCCDALNDRDGWGAWRDDSQVVDATVRKRFGRVERTVVRIRTVRSPENAPSADTSRLVS